MIVILRYATELSTAVNEGGSTWSTCWKQGRATLLPHVYVARHCCDVALICVSETFVSELTATLPYSLEIVSEEIKVVELVSIMLDISAVNYYTTPGSIGAMHIHTCPSHSGM